MAQRQTREQFGVKPNDQIVIKGYVTFARLDKLVDGDALQKENARREKLGMMVTKPFRSIAIENPQIIQGQGTPLANFHSQEVYTDKQGRQILNMESKSLFPPTFGHIQNGKIVEIPDPQRNPNQGQEVYLMINAFKAKGFSNLGSSFNAIVYGEGDIDFYQGGNGLSGFGEALGMEVEQMTGDASQGQPEPVQNTQNAGNQAQGQNAFGAPEQNQGQNTFAGFGEQAQPQQNAFQQQPQPETAPASPQGGSPFGVQDNDIANSQAFGGNASSGAGFQNPFGNDANSGAGGQSPYA